jgi:hypothetical protein
MIKSGTFGQFKKVFGNAYTILNSLKKEIVFDSWPKECGYGYGLFISYVDINENTFSAVS